MSWPSVVIGTYRHRGVQVHRESMEVAAWFRDYRCEAQEVPVHMSWTPERCPQFAWCHLDGVCVDACLVSLFGGVAFGNDTAGKAAIGQPGKVSIHFPVYALPSDVVLKPEYSFLRRDRCHWDHELANGYCQALARTGRKACPSAINLDWLEKNADPELWHAVKP